MKKRQHAPKPDQDMSQVSAPMVLFNHFANARVWQSLRDARHVG
ncbi:MAG: hypothetical protein AAFX95_25215 [Cyanobacteria bacterium J06639_16]